MTGHELDFAVLRQQLRAILLQDGTAIGPNAETPEHVDTIIAKLLERHRPHVRRASDALLASTHLPHALVGQLPVPVDRSTEVAPEVV
jgi:hypothetical protein